MSYNEYHYTIPQHFLSMVEESSTTLLPPHFIKKNLVSFLSDEPEIFAHSTIIKFEGLNEEHDSEDDYLFCANSNSLQIHARFHCLMD